MKLQLMFSKKGYLKTKSYKILKLKRKGLEPL